MGYDFYSKFLFLKICILRFIIVVNCIYEVVMNNVMVGVIVIWGNVL